MKINDNGTDRDMTEGEQLQHETWVVIAQAEADALAEVQVAKAAARQIVLDRLGITSEEAQLLLG